MELRRGVLIMAVLTALQKEHYGYMLRKQLSAIGLDIDEGTLYPLLRRLETQGLLLSKWREQDGRKRRFYRTSNDGNDAITQMNNEWCNLNAAMGKLTEKQS